MTQALGDELERPEGCLLPVWALFIYICIFWWRKVTGECPGLHRCA